MTAYAQHTHTEKKKGIKMFMVVFIYNRFQMQSTQMSVRPYLGKGQTVVLSTQWIHSLIKNK